MQPLTTYVLTDAPNLNATANDIGYDASASYDSGSVGKAIKGCIKADNLTVYEGTYTTNANGTVDSNLMISGGIPYATYDIISIWSEDGYLPVISKYNTRYTFDIHANSDFSLVRSASVKLKVIIASNLTR